MVAPAADVRREDRKGTSRSTHRPPTESGQRATGRTRGWSGHANARLVDITTRLRRAEGPSLPRTNGPVPFGGAEGTTGGVIKTATEEPAFVHANAS